MLSSFEGPVALIAHNGLRFDCRVLLAELRRTELLEKYPIPSSVYFMDSYLGFLDLEKGYHDEIATIMTNINWRMSKTLLFHLLNQLTILFSHKCRYTKTLD